MNDEISKKINSNRRINNIKIGISVEFNDIGGSAILGDNKYKWFNIQPLHSISNNNIKITNVGSLTNEELEPDKTSIYTKYDHIYDNITELYYYIYDVYPTVSTFDNDYIAKFINKCTKKTGFNALVSASNTGDNIINENIKNLFKVNAYKEYDVIDNKIDYVDSGTNGVYIKQNNNNITELSVEQTFSKNDNPVNCYIKLTYNKTGNPLLEWFDTNDNEPHSFELTKLLTL